MIVTVLDVETTGLIPDSDRIIQFGATIIDTSTEKEIDAVNIIIKPRKNSCYVPYEAYRVHGISEEYIKANGKLFKSVYKTIESTISRADVVCAYNHSFDKAFIEHALLGMGTRIPDKDWIDPLLIAQRFIPYSVAPKKNLLAMCAMFDVPLNKEDAHKADADARATGILLFRMLKELDISITNVLDPTFKMYGKYHTSQKHFDPMESLYSGLPKKSI